MGVDFSRKKNFLINNSARSQKEWPGYAILYLIPKFAYSVAPIQWFPVVYGWICYNEITYEMSDSCVHLSGSEYQMVFGNLENIKGNTNGNS